MCWISRSRGSLQIFDSSVRERKMQNTISKRVVHIWSIALRITLCTTAYFLSFRNSIASPHEKPATSTWDSKLQLSCSWHLAQSKWEGCCRWTPTLTDISRALMRLHRCNSDPNLPLQLQSKDFLCHLYLLSWNSSISVAEVGKKIQFIWIFSVSTCVLKFITLIKANKVLQVVFDKDFRHLTTTGPFSSSNDFCHSHGLSPQRHF